MDGKLSKHVNGMHDLGPRQTQHVNGMHDLGPGQTTPGSWHSNCRGDLRRRQPLVLNGMAGAECCNAQSLLLWSRSMLRWERT